MILEWSVLKSVHDIQSFLEFTNFYQRFIEHYSRIVISITNLLRKNNNQFEWFDIAQRVFKELKSLFPMNLFYVISILHYQSRFMLMHLDLHFMASLVNYSKNNDIQLHINQGNAFLSIVIMISTIEKCKQWFLRWNIDIIISKIQSIQSKFWWITRI